ncbi:MAG: hypothetical protein EBS85_03515 [Micrococcales bacterium]|jgi:hypothetical protein|nr:hypothetical protein [Actinomycetota bacterium]NCA07779.1 hypothetical protein [Micrococcales bacterium]
MGSGTGGGFSGGASLGANVARLAGKYGFNQQSGKFGVSGEGKSRVIVSDNPTATAQAFFKDLSAGGKVSNTGKGKVAIFSDKSSVFFRETSSSGGPAVNIKITGSQAQRYKIHFEPTGWIKGKDK